MTVPLFTATKVVVKNIYPKPTKTGASQLLKREEVAQEQKKPKKGEPTKVPIVPIVVKAGKVDALNKTPKQKAIDEEVFKTRPKWLYTGIWYGDTGERGRTGWQKHAWNVDQVRGACACYNPPLGTHTYHETVTKTVSKYS
jgi:hypothetical protein